MSVDYLLIEIRTSIYVTDSAITLINVTESEKGVRKVLSNYRSLTARVVTLAGNSIECESALEKDFAELLDFNSRVGAIGAQPLTIKYKVAGESGVRRYTPDFLVKFRNSHQKTPWQPILYEVKFRDELEEKKQELAYGFAAAKLLCRSRRWRFRVVTDTFIRTPFLENVKFLRGFRTYPDTGVHSAMLLAAIEQLGVATPAELLAETFQDMQRRMEAVGVLWRLIANRSIGADLMSKLTMSSEIWHEEPVLYAANI